MKFVKIEVLVALLMLLATNAFSATDWNKVYSSMDNRDARMTPEDYVEACKQGVLNACDDGWNKKVNALADKRTNYELDLSIQPSFINMTEEECQADEKSHYCFSGLSNILSAISKEISKIAEKRSELERIKALDEKANSEEKSTFIKLSEEIEQNSTVVKNAEQMLKKYAESPCLKGFEVGETLSFCETYYEIHKNDLVQSLNNLTEKCKLKNDIKSCGASFHISKMLETDNNNLNSKFVNEVCGKSTEIDSLPFCIEKKKNLEQSEQERKERKTRSQMWSIALWSIGLIALFLWLRSSQCSNCKKYFAYKLVSTSDKGISEREYTENVKTGDIRDRDGNVHSELYQDVRITEINSHFSDHYRCKYCGHLKTESRTVTNKHRT